MWTCFLFFRVLPRGAIVGHILSVYSTWWKTAKPFSGWLNCLAFSPKTVSMPIALHSRQVFYLSCSDRFAVASHLTLICVSPVANDDDKLEHLFICLFAFCRSFLVKCLFFFFCLFFDWLLVFSQVSFESSLHIPDTRSLSDESFADTSPRLWLFSSFS